LADLSCLGCLGCLGCFRRLGCLGCLPALGRRLVLLLLEAPLVRETILADLLTGCQLAPLG
jgi:hypothetical protein